MQAERVFKFMGVDHPITYTYQKVILKLHNGKSLHGFFDKNMLNPYSEAYLNNQWNFQIISGNKQVVIAGNEIESISLYQNDRVVYQISDKS